MKQHITPEEWGIFERSNPKAAQKLRDYYGKWQSKHLEEHYQREFVTMDWEPIHVFLTIGRLLEFLVDNERPDCDMWLQRIRKWRFEGDHGVFWMSERGTLEYDEPCDALWSAVKKVLEGK